MLLSKSNMNILTAPGHSCAGNGIPPLAEAPAATNVEEMLPDSGFVGSSFIESGRGILFLPVS